MRKEVVTGSIHLDTDPNCVIQRKGKVIPFPSAQEGMRLLDKSVASGDSAEYQKFLDSCPKLAAGDILVTGPKSVAMLNTSYNKGKDTPIEGDFKVTASKLIVLGPGSQLKVLGRESWDRTDKKESTRYTGECITGVEILSGFFHCSYSYCDDELATPLATIKIKGSAGGFFDLSGGNLYSRPNANARGCSIDFTNNRTKKTFTVEGGISGEIVVTPDAIYERGAIVGEFAATVPLQLIGLAQSLGSVKFSEASMEKQVNGMQNIAKTGKEVVTGLETLKRMDPKDLESMMRSGGASDEQIKMMLEGQAGIKEMDQKGMLKEMAGAFAQVGAMSEGIGADNISKLMHLQGGAQEKVGAYLSTTRKQFEALVGKPRDYAPLKSEQRVA